MALNIFNPWPSGVKTNFCVTKKIIAIKLVRLNHDTQLNDTQHSDTKHNDTQHNDTQHNDLMISVTFTQV